MKVVTKSGVISVNKRSPYGKWVISYCKAGGWSGSCTLENMWNLNKKKKPKGCSWEAWGELCAWLYWSHYCVIQDLKYEIHYLEENQK
jgi:hypothetical protein